MVNIRCKVQVKYTYMRNTGTYINWSTNHQGFFHLIGYNIILGWRGQIILNRCSSLPLNMNVLSISLISKEIDSKSQPGFKPTTSNPQVRYSSTEQLGVVQPLRSTIYKWLSIEWRDLENWNEIRGNFFTEQCDFGLVI